MGGCACMCVCEGKGGMGQASSLHLFASYVKMFTLITDDIQMLLNFERRSHFTDIWSAAYTHFSQSHRQNDQQQTTLELHQLPEYKNSVFHHPNPHLIRKHNHKEYYQILSDLKATLVFTSHRPLV